MTTQKRTLVSPADVVGIEYECSHCHARYSVPVERFDRFIRQCPNCHERWFTEEAGKHPPLAQAVSQAKSTDGSDDAAFVEFVAAFQRLRKLSAGVAIRFEILEFPDRE